MEDDFDEQTKIYQSSKQHSDTASHRYRKAKQLKEQLAGELSKCQMEQRHMSQPPRFQQLKLRSAYLYQYYPWQLFGKVWIKGSVLNTDKDRQLLLIDIQSKDRQEDKEYENVKLEDVNHLSSQQEHLASAKFIEKQLQLKAFSKLRQKLVSFFKQHPKRYLIWAKQAEARHDYLLAGENLSLFLDSFPEQAERNERYKLTKQKLATILRSPLE